MHKEILASSSLELQLWIGGKQWKAFLRPRLFFYHGKNPEYSFNSPGL